MRRERYQPGIRSGAVVNRRTTSKNSPKVYAGAKPSSRRLPNRVSSRIQNRRPNRPGRDSNDEGRGSSVMWSLIVIGAALSAVFIFALRSQINTHKFEQAEEHLKKKLDDYASQQKFLELDQQRALNTDESDRAARRNGLDQLKLDGAALRVGAANPTPVNTPPVTQVKTPQAGPKAAKIIKVVKSSAVKSPKARVIKAPIVKVKKQNNKQRQPARTQSRR